MDDYEKRIKNEQGFHNSDDWRKNREHLEKYRSIFTKEKGTKAYRDKIIMENIRPDYSVFLDYGCGNGSYMLNISDKIKSGYGIDLSKKEIESVSKECEEKKVKNIHYSVMDAMNTEFDNKTFDIIHGNAILHHLDLEKSITEIKRILKDDGVGVFIEPLSTNPIIELYRKLTPKLRTPDERPFRIKELKLLKKNFKNIKIKYFGCFTLLAVMFRKSKHFEKILNILYSMDDAILSSKSPFKLLAWVCVIELRK